MAPGVQALSDSPSWGVHPPSLVRAPKGRSGVAPGGTAAALFATAGKVVELAMAFVVEVAAGRVVAFTVTGGRVGGVDAGAVVGGIGSGVVGCALETCSAGGAVLVVLGALAELLQATETATHTRHAAIPDCLRSPRGKRRLFIQPDPALAPKRCKRRTRAIGVGRPRPVRWCEP